MMSAGSEIMSRCLRSGAQRSQPVEQGTAGAGHNAVLLHATRVPGAVVRAVPACIWQELNSCAAP